MSSYEFDTTMECRDNGVLCGVVMRNGRGCLLDGVPPSAPPDVPPRNPTMNRMNGRVTGNPSDLGVDFEPSCLVRTPSGNVYIPSGNININNKGSPIDYKTGSACSTPTKDTLKSYDRNCLGPVLPPRSSMGPPSHYSAPMFRKGLASKCTWKCTAIFVILLSVLLGISLIFVTNVLSWPYQASPPCTVLVDESAEITAAKSVISESNRSKPTTISSSTSSATSAQSAAAASQASSASTTSSQTPTANGNQADGGRSSRTNGRNRLKRSVGHVASSVSPLYSSVSGFPNTLVNDHAQFSISAVPSNPFVHFLPLSSIAPLSDYDSVEAQTSLVMANTNRNPSVSDNDYDENTVASSTTISYSSTVEEADEHNVDDNNEQSDDPSSFLAYEHHQQENVVEIVSLDNDGFEDSEELKKKIKYESDEENIKFHPLRQDEENHFVINPIAEHTPHYYMHEGVGGEDKLNKTTEDTDQPRILVNVSIASDSGQGTPVHAVYSLHVMVPSGRDFFPPQKPTPCDCSEAVTLNFTRTLESLVDKGPPPPPESTPKVESMPDAKPDFSCPILILEGEGVSFNNLKSFFN